jgi:hypothetical protein
MKQSSIIQRNDFDRWTEAVLFTIWFTASGDILFNLPIGFSVRVTTILASVFGLVWIFNNGIRFPRSVGFIALVLLSALNAAFSYHNSYPVRALAYAAWLFSFVIYIWGFILVCRTEARLIRFGRIYCASGLLVTLYGILMWDGEEFGLDIGLVTQPGRINGFSYEPSYFATYIIPFWIIFAYCLEKRAPVLSSKLLDVSCFCLLSMGLILSTARTGFLALLIWYGRLVVMSILNVFLSRWSSGSFRALGLFSVVAMLSGIVLVYSGGGNVYDLLSGTGLLETASHSTDQRLDSMLLTWEVFLKSPIYGVGLGGVASEIATLSGQSVSTMSEARVSEGASVFLEILAGTGIFGFLLLIYSFVNVAWSALRGSFRLSVSVLARAYVWAFLIQLLVLQLNQNILRSYFWYHLAFVFAFGLVVSRSPGKHYRVS